MLIGEDTLIFFVFFFGGGAEGCKAREEDFCPGETTERKLLVGKGQLPPPPDLSS